MIFLSLAGLIKSYIKQVFSPINLPFTKPVPVVDINWNSLDLIRELMTIDVSLYNTRISDIGRHFYLLDLFACPLLECNK